MEGKDTKLLNYVISLGLDIVFQVTCEAPSTDQILECMIVNACDSEDNGTECKICLSLAVNIAFIPCGHACCCVSCAEQLGACPGCCGRVDRKLQISLRANKYNKNVYGVDSFTHLD